MRPLYVKCNILLIFFCGKYLQIYKFIYENAAKYISI